MKSQRALDVATCLINAGRALQEAAKYLQQGLNGSEPAPHARQHAQQEAPEVSRSRTVQAVAPSPRLPPEERLTSKQLGAIRVASRRAGVSPDQLARLVAEVSESAERLEQLSRAEASALLDRLDERTGYAH